MPKAVLSGLKKEPVQITAVCSMFDTGGSSGRLRHDYGIKAPGDLRRALLALANTSPVVENLFNYRFEVGELTGHNFANLLITALELTLNDYEKTIDELKKILHVEHEVLPITLDESELFARLENGEIIKGETNIDRPKHKAELKIEEVFLRPRPVVYAKVVGAIEKADLIVIGPGDIYSTIAQLLLPIGMVSALQSTGARVIYLCNLMTKKGETHGFGVRDFADQIRKWAQRDVCCVFNNNFPDEKRVREYMVSHPELLKIVEFEEGLKSNGFVGADLIRDSGPVEHDPLKVARTLLKMC